LTKFDQVKLWILKQWHLHASIWHSILFHMEKSWIPILLYSSRSTFVMWTNFSFDTISTIYHFQFQFSTWLETALLHSMDAWWLGWWALTISSTGRWKMRRRHGKWRDVVGLSNFIPSIQLWWTSVSFLFNPEIKLVNSLSSSY
jgi:hypothetical protein